MHHSPTDGPPPSSHPIHTGGAGHTPSSPTPSHQPVVMPPADPAAPPMPPGYPGYPPYPGYPYPGYPYSPYPPYGQPGYPVYGYPYPPVYLPPAVPQPPQARQSHKALWITLSVVGGLLLVLCVSCSVLLAVSVSRISTQPTSVSPGIDPVVAASDFCSYEINQDYTSAYDLLSPNLQGQISQQQFISDNQARDALQGRVIGCSAASQQSTASDATPSSPTTLTLNIWLAPTAGNSSNGPPTNLSGDITMAQQSDGSWKLDTIDSTLPLT